MKNNYDQLYEYAYSMLENSTPLKTDCGTLCDKKCCSGDGETGMLLFPNEKTTLNIIENNGRFLAVCSGNCKRNERPLSCRLFPFFPVIDEKGNVRVEIDFRGFGICPLVEHRDEIVFSQRFLHRVRKVGEALAKDEQCRSFMKKISEEIAQEENVISMLLK